jgi:hypothetical protein
MPADPDEIEKLDRIVSELIPDACPFCQAAFLLNALETFMPSKVLGKEYQCGTQAFVTGSQPQSTKCKLTIARCRIAELEGCLHADNLPPPPIQSFPIDDFAEAYRAWYHGPRALAIINGAKPNE